MNMPNMWLSEKYGIRRKFRMINVGKVNGINENQPGVVKVEDGKVYNEMFCYITSIEDRGDFWYIGYKPCGESIGRCGFGYTRLYKDGAHEYGTVAFEDVRR